MSRRFLILLERATRIRELIDREQRSAAPNVLRLMRMKQLYLSLSSSLRKMTEKRLVAMASAPSFTPRIAFPSAHSGPVFSGRW
ncbi:MAG: hypothetical protein QM780_03235 [Hyphomicrobium sp.]|uniref:hypothetical protein n=1 Tax=Hyphomicrobium sp. TaxID=82 RepID=UPI0039E65830